ncbi:MAG: hypothetical protein ACYTEL_25665 [Planctomycetota bacterium]
MKDESPEIVQAKHIGSTVYAVVVHSSVPLMLLFLSVYVMPRVQQSSFRIGDELPASLTRIVPVTDFIGRHWHIYVVLLAMAVAADAMICYHLFRSGRRLAAFIWVSLIAAAELGVVGWCAYGVMSSVYGLGDSALYGQ